MEEYAVSDDSILDILSEVTEAKRVASMVNLICGIEAHTLMFFIVFA